MTMRLLLAASERLFPNVRQFDQKLWRRLSECGVVERKRPGRAYDALLPREVAAFVLAKLAHDDLEDAVAVTTAIMDMPGRIDGVPTHWTDTAALADGTLLDWFGALLADFAVGRADKDRGLNSCEVRLTTPLPTVTIGLSAEWRVDRHYRHLQPLQGRFARSPEYADDGDMAADIAAINATQPKSLRMTSIVTERSIGLNVVREFAKAVIGVPR
jgi:hypothetical protein